jgi:hypothetical protein
MTGWSQRHERERSMSSYLVHYAHAQHRATNERRFREGRIAHDEQLPTQRGRVWRRVLDR